MLVREPDLGGWLGWGWIDDFVQGMDLMKLIQNSRPYKKKDDFIEKTCKASINLKGITRAFSYLDAWKRSLITKSNSTFGCFGTRTSLIAFQQVGSTQQLVVSKWCFFDSSKGQSSPLFFLEDPSSQRSIKRVVLEHGSMLQPTVRDFLGENL